MRLLFLGLSVFFLSLSAYSYEAKSFIASTGNTVYYQIMKMPLSNVWIGIGKKYSNQSAVDNDPEKCLLSHGTNGPLVHGDGNTVGGFCDCRCDPAQNSACRTNDIRTLATNCSSSARRPFLSKSQVDGEGGNFAMNEKGYSGALDGKGNAAKTLNGILSIDRNLTPKICMLKDSKCDQSVKCEGSGEGSAIFAIQNGPVLVKDGVNFHTRHNNSRKTRSGLGFIGGTLVYIHASHAIPAGGGRKLDGVSFNELATLFIKNGVNNSIYLDGARSYAGSFDSSSGNYQRIVGNTVREAYKLQFYDCNRNRGSVNASSPNQTLSI